MLEQVGFVASRSRDVIDHQSPRNGRFDFGDVESDGEVTHDGNGQRHEQDRQANVDPQVPRAGVQVAQRRVSKLLFVAFQVALEVDGQRHAQTEHHHDRHQHDQVPLERQILHGIGAALGTDLFVSEKINKNLNHATLSRNSKKMGINGY